MKLKNTTRTKENRSGIKVLYLFNGPRREAISNIQNGEQPDDHLYGFLRLRKFGIETDYFDIEDYLPKFLARLFRRYLTVYFVHLPFFWKFFKYDFIFAPNSYGSMFFLALLPFKKPKFVLYDFSALGLIGKGQSVRQKLFKWALERSGGIITIGEREARELRRIFPNLAEKIEFIPFGTDTNFFRPLSMSPGHQIITVGFDPSRDYDTLFKATSELGVRVIATRSRKAEALEKIPQHVSIRYFSWADLVEEYAKSKVVVLPLDIASGVNEAAGCSSLVEALSCGKVIVASRTPTTESYIENGGNGFLVEPKDISSMKLLLSEILKDEPKRKEIETKARASAVDKFSAELSALKMAEFFKRISSLES